MMVKTIARVLFVAVFLFGFSTYVLGDPLLTFYTNTGSGGVPELHLYLLDVGAGDEPIEITPPEVNAAVPTWSPDGSHILFYGQSQVEVEFNIDLYTMDADGKNLQRLTNTPNWEGDPAWSPDGQKVAYFTGNPIELNRSLWVLDLNSGVKRELVPPGGEVSIGVTRVVWSPDGQRVAFNAIGAANKAGLYAVQVDTKQVTPIHEGLFFMTVQDWLPTGELLVIEGNGRKLGLLSPDGGFEELFSEIQEKFQIYDARSTWRWPDLFVFNAYLVGSILENLNVYRAKRNGTGFRLLADMERATWSPDLWYDALGVLPVSKLTTTWGEVKGDRVR